METLESMRGEVKTELLTHIIPFWRALRDDTYGGYYGWLSYDLALDQKAEKGCILNSRITWFFSNAYTAYRKGLFTEEDCRSAGYTGEALLEEAKHGYVFLKEHCIDREYGGIYWSLNYDGTPLDTTKHTYNQAFCIYALSSYYEASHDEEALALAKQLFSLIEEKCTDEVGYLEAFTREFQPESNEKLSENGVLADKTMNTLLHVFEAYTELYRVSRDETVGERLRWIMDVFAEKVYNPAKRRQEVFFDAGYHTILDLHSYGHDIETAWLLDRGVKVLGDEAYEAKIVPITQALAAHIYETAFDGHSLANECDRGVVNNIRRLILFLRLECSDDAGNNGNHGDKGKKHKRYIFKNDPDNGSCRILFSALFHLHRPLCCFFRRSLFFVKLFQPLSLFPGHDFIVLIRIAVYIFKEQFL